MKLLLQGVGVCKGKVTGKAIVLKDLTNVPKVEDGCIIVTPFFTPLISILVSNAKAVLTDFGGVTSHAAVIAREFNIPCIVALNQATSVIKDGQTICMDGDNGEVYEI